MGRGKRPATYEDIEALPPGWVGEIIDDELWAFPRPATWHTRAASKLGALLDRFDAGQGGPGGWWILDEPELHFGRQVLVPDLAGWRRERAPGLLERDEPFFDLAPDWICEVLSPSTAALDRGRKLDVYLQEGVSHAWLVDPRAHALDVYRRGKKGWRLVARHGGEEVIRAEPFDAEPLELGLLWAPKSTPAPGLGGPGSAGSTPG
ncbi:Uma2 family endonuclease [Archangium lansingense]|uniref:Uma2 family endonuclease n=1 Tax=Archangium lansingense TaxID=2995310 RepID=A0ABT4ABX6_9BACT|nr:Uma2 family endonuclease [Archangium lansinium]MCY1078412.1 Uma2 family endonuclease [Archangium lansinium]